MSIRYEWTTAAHTSAVYISPGHRVDGQPVEPGEEDAEGVTNSGAIVLGYDEAFIIEGTRDELRDLIKRMNVAVPPF